MLSVIITAYKEEKSISKCVKSVLSQKIKKIEIIVIAPDNPTLNAAKKAGKSIKVVKDEGKGKWDALNLGFKKARGNILILLDGDTYLKHNSIKSILEKFENSDVGIVSGRVISANNKNNLLGYWSHLLVNAAHEERVKRVKKREFIMCTGYLIGLRKGIVKKLPPDLLSEDAYISHYVWSKGYDTAYSPSAEVVVKYPATWSDWVKQKRRSAGGYHQLNKYFKKSPRMRSFTIEALKGPYYALSYAKNPVEFVWSLLLFPARLYLWLLTFYDKLTKKKFKEVWKRVETTK